MKNFSVSRRDSNRGSPDLIHDELDHRATVPCLNLRNIVMVLLGDFNERKNLFTQVISEEKVKFSGPAYFFIYFFLFFLFFFCWLAT